MPLDTIVGNAGRQAASNHAAFMAGTAPSLLVQFGNIRNQPLDLGGSFKMRLAQ